MRCRNCGQDLPEDRFQLHQAYCLRHNVRCPLCQKVVSKANMIAHQEELHRAKPCHACGQPLTAQQLKRHDCPQRQDECQYCELMLPLKHLFDHQEMCGSKTRTCEFCRRRVTQRDYFEHRQQCERTPLSGTEPFEKSQDELLEEALLQQVCQMSRKEA